MQREWLFVIPLFFCRSELEGKRVLRYKNVESGMIGNLSSKYDEFYVKMSKRNRDLENSNF